MKILIDVNTKTTPTDYSWQFGIGADHAFQFHRLDIIDQLKYAHDELGFKRVRFHGIFDDDMCTYQNLKAFAPIPGRKIPVQEINFRQVGSIYDNILACGVEPFVELSFMPSPLAKGKKTGLQYKNNITPPANYDEWENYIEQFIIFLTNRYGKECVEKWYFEVWNEPDLKNFFSGKQKDYFRLYKSTVTAIRRSNPNIKVGGPSTSACKWIDEFLDYCKRNNAPIDFLSTHHYPGDAFGNLITPAKYSSIAKIMLRAWKKKAPLDETMANMFFHKEVAAQVPKGAITRMDNELIEHTQGIPTFISEWNSMAIFAAPIHDEKYSAAFVIKTILDLNNKFSGYMFWCLSDIYEEILQLNRPFFGGFGLLTVDGIPKPNFWAFKMLSQLLPNRHINDFRTNSDVEYAVFQDDNKIQVLVYAQSNDLSENKTYEIDINLNIYASAATVQIIDDIHCNPKKEWQKLGSLNNLSQKQVTEIKKQTCLIEEEHFVKNSEGQSELHCKLHTNDVHLYTITRGGKENGKI